MKIAIIAPSPVPFVLGGAEAFCTGWLAALNAQPGVEAELIKLPSPERNFWEVLASYRQFAALDLRHFDRVLSAKYPAWMVAHPDHHVLMLHTLRGLYDTWPSGLPTQIPEHLARATPPAVAKVLQLCECLPHTRQSLEPIFAAIAELQHQAPNLSPEWFTLPGALLRRIVHTLDAIGLARGAIRSHAAISATVAARAGYFPPDVPAAEIAVHHPPALPRPRPESTPGDPDAATALPGVPPGPIVLTASRLDAPKRIPLIIAAYQHAFDQAQAAGQTLPPLVIAGAGPQAQALADQIAHHPASAAHIHCVGRITDAQLAAAYARATLVPYTPAQEDYGYIALEALQAGVPVLTVADAGGPTELVRHGHNGWIVEPTVPALAQALHHLLTHPKERAALAAHAAASVAHIQWPALARHYARRLPRIAVVNTFAVYPAQGGGQLRLLNLYREVARHADVRLVNLGPDPAAPTQTRHLAPGLTEIVAPPGPEQLAHCTALEAVVRASAMDVSAMQAPQHSPAWLAAIADACAWAHTVVACHPYGYPAIRQVWPGPVVYESLNVEYDLKAAIFGTHAPQVLAQVQAVEAACATQAPVVLACSPQDAQRLQTLYALPALPTLVPNAVAAHTYPDPAPAPIGPHQPAIALFVGSLHGPNNDALLALLDIARQYQALCAAQPQTPPCQFVVLGSVCRAPGLPQALPPHVHLLGTVSSAELRAWLARAHIGLNPMASGSGTNLKLLEYAAAGLPILSTPFGARGGLLQPGTHYLSAELPDFAPALAQALQAPGWAQCTQRARAARALVRQHGTWAAAATQALNALQPLLHIA